MVLIAFAILIVLVWVVVILCRRNGKSTIFFSTSIPALSNLHVAKGDISNPSEGSINNRTLNEHLVNVDRDLRNAPVGGVERLTVRDVFSNLRQLFEKAMNRRKRAVARAKGIYGGGQNTGSDLPDVQSGK